MSLPFGLGLTRQGLMAAAIITIRVAISISLVMLVTLTTPWARLLSALRALGVPRMFVLVIGMAYRYLFVLLGAVQDMYVARKARSIAPERDARGGRAAAQVAPVVSEARTLDRFRVTALDIAVLTCAVLCMLLLIGGDRAIG